MYIDVLFILNFLMDLIVLLLSSRILADTSLPVLLRCRPGFGPSAMRLVLAALAGALAGCVLTVLARVYGVTALETGPCSAAAGVLLCGVMAGIAFRPRSVRGWIRQLLTVYAAAFLTGGVLDQVQLHLGTGRYFLAIVISVVILGAGQRLYGRVKEAVSAIYHVNIDTGGSVLKLKGLLDTGNLLTVPVLGTPVSVISEKALLKGLSSENIRRYDYIKKNHQIPEGCEKEWFLVPFHSVGCENGLMPVLSVPHMCIRTERDERVITGAMLGISESVLSSAGRYELILSPKVLRGSV